MSNLLISTCENELSEREFVNPISRIVGTNNHEILHYKHCTEKTIFSFDKIIICGTSLNDDSYITNLGNFKKLFLRKNKKLLNHKLENGKKIENLEN